ncbi:sister chromatid cohesion protein-like protein Mis4 [Dendryphion nanum]|uniref:Sister chromatid cohesion protein n=1 Tax=Dendryphion nanum TaxID=256645 RepID=A0A9P9IS68_9PLEO|nr:sister chromatid cohesion protein-like protein Mis4 [Dendryphion nanum]
MSGYNNGHWHTANGGGLPLRPPTVDEALPYSPFTSLMPFSPEIIPYPSAEPPTPPSTLTDEQRNAGKRVMDTLNEEAKAPPGTSSTLRTTMMELRSLLDPNDLPEYKFKATTQLSTPPPDSPVKDSTTPTSTRAPTLNRFADLLLRNTDIAYQHPGLHPTQHAHSNRSLPTQPTLPTPNRATPQHYAPSVPSLSQNITPSSTSSSTPQRAGPAIVVKPLPTNARREEYQRYDNITPSNGMAAAKIADRSNDRLSAMKPQEREIAEHNIKKLKSFVSRLVTERDDPDQSSSFTTLVTDEGERVVLNGRGFSELSQAVRAVMDKDYFSAVSVKTVLLIQSLCEPLITATTQLPLFLLGQDPRDATDRLLHALTGVKACKLALDTMTKSRDDHQLRSEDLVQNIVSILKNVLQSCIIPITQSRPSSDPESEQLFNWATQHNQDTKDLLRLSGDIFELITSLIAKVKMDESALSAIESLSVDIIFAQGGEKESESAFGTKNFESFRQKSMGAIVQIFASSDRLQKQRITSEVLSNLDRLPEKRASARNFKTPHGSIMLISALFMRFVQVATHDDASPKTANGSDHAKASSEDDSGDDHELGMGHSKATSPKLSPNQIVEQTWNCAVATAWQIANHLVLRATNVSKSGDKPFRILLDYSIEDFCNLLGYSDWPAASSLLGSILTQMVKIMRNPKKEGVQAADMALAVMSSMGAGTIDLQKRLKDLKGKMNVAQSECSSKLVPLADDALNSNINNHDIFGLQGPYRAVLDSLQGDLSSHESESERMNSSSLRRYYITSWAHNCHEAFQPKETDEVLPKSVIELQIQLQQLVTEPNRFLKEIFFPRMSDNERQLAAGIVALQSPFCKYFPQILNTFLSNIKSDTVKIKSRAVSSLSSLIEKDAHILSRPMIQSFISLLDDPSPSVRENMLTLLGKRLETDPSLHILCLPSLVRLLRDEKNTGPKKKAIKQVKEIYEARAKSEDKVATKSEYNVRIATALLPLLFDEDKGIAELVHQTFEDMWLGPFEATSKTDENRTKINRTNRVLVLVDTVHGIRDQTANRQAFESFFKTALSVKSKNYDKNIKICKVLLDELAESIIGTDSPSMENSQSRFLQTMSVFAKVNPKLFTASQVQMLKPYVKSFKDRTDISVFQPTVVIFRYVIPSLSSLEDAFLEEVRMALSQAIQTTASGAAQGLSSDYRDTLLDIAHCLWTISPLLKGEPGRKSGSEKLVTMIVSTASLLQPLSSVPIASISADKIDPHKRKIKSFLLILGSFGQASDLDVFIDTFKAECTRKFPGATPKADRAKLPPIQRWIASSGSSVAVLLIDLVRMFTTPQWETPIRAHALRCLAQICQQKPQHFARADIDKVFKLPFINGDVELMRVILGQFCEFFVDAERRSDAAVENAGKEGAVQGAARMETSFTASGQDTATMHLARGFLQSIVDVALHRSDDLAQRATEIIGSISRQGLVHPKECGPSLVALSTSRVGTIAKIAAAEHLKIHLQHETMFEKEYVEAVKFAFRYQLEVFNDSRGAVMDTTQSTTQIRPKLYALFEAFKSGTRKVLKKFITNMFREINFTPSTLEHKGDAPEPLLFARFCLDNFASFDYSRNDDVILVISIIESIVLKETGPSVALEEDFPRSDITEQQPQETLIEGVPAETKIPQPVGPDDSLHKPAVASIILRLMWDTRSHLRRFYNLPGKITAKDTQRPITKLHFLTTGKELWENFDTVMSSLSSREGMIKACNGLTEIISVDAEHAVAEGAADAEASEQLAKAVAGYETPDEDEEDGPVPTSGRNRKRKGSGNMGNTPKRARGRLSGGKSKKRSSKTPDDDDWD